MTSTSKSGPRVTAARHQRRAPRMADLVADELRDRILSGDLVDGSELPIEASLLDEFKVSRPSLREGLRILETEGLVRVRRGNKGGAVVQRPSPRSGAYHLSLVLQSVGVGIEDLATARQVLEPVCAGMCAQSPNGESIASELDALTDASEKMDGTDEEFTASLLEFHHAIVELAGNRTMAVLIGTLESVWQAQEKDWAKQASFHGNYPGQAGRADAVSAHRRITERIRGGDVEGALRAARRHISATSSLVAYTTAANLAEASKIANMLNAQLLR